MCAYPCVTRGFGLVAVVLACIANCRSQVDIPLEVYRGYVVVVRGSIGDLHNLNFVVDTGAVPTVVHKRVVKRLRLNRTRSRLLTLNRVATTEQVALSDLAVGPVRRERLRVIVNDLSDIEEGLGVRIDALIGLDVLDQTSLSIDYKSRRITFGPLNPPDSPVPFVPAHPFLMVPFSVQGRQFRLMLDTGVKDLILYDNRVVGTPLGFRTLSQKLTFGLAGPVRLQRVEMREGQFGKLRYPALEAVLLEQPVELAYPFDGVLGAVALGASRLEFDFERGIIDIHR